MKKYTFPAKIVSSIAKTSLTDQTRPYAKYANNKGIILSHPSGRQTSLCILHKAT